MRTVEGMNAKRVFDIAAALTGLLLLSPLLLTLMLLIRLEDGGPALFVQQRIGRDLKPFALFKLRSMRNGGVTRVGRWIRRTGLDEMLQFINVLNGSMSLVGPRPLTREDLQRLGLYDGNRPRFRLRPGITGMAQLYAGRGLRVSCFLERKYQARQSVCLDLVIVLLSLLVNIFGKRRIGGWLDRLRHKSV